ncbi:N-acetylmuramoyl-L-alanine amidase [Nocardioides marmorisolisilvae]|uniref:N-acetylmuramoyl-L-alanine amidase n=1 Tax=Nocardioides marmorisolisilvae TaxID=1542737 RepID=A0A3N0DI93_9ACTN|nr:peptidoglycan-binding protein [Nocardioides marmorisolisilvae]RNL75404.1 N-acetylmuramoyl-L-alanine amidase [Nocardioides marmorisolisilvae]
MTTTTFRNGDAGPAVTQIVGLLDQLGLIEGDLPGSFDDRVELAVRTFQQQRGLHVDGVVGVATFRRMDEARWTLGDRILTHLPGSLMAGDDVFALQRRLLELGFKVGRVDGYFGPETEAGLRDFQRNVGIPADGTCGPLTLKMLAQLAPMVSGGAPNAMRAQERIRDAGPQLGGKIVVIDPSPGQHLPDEYAETAAEIVHDLAARIEGRLVATGVQAFLTASRSGRHRAEVEDATQETERAQFANRANAHLSISLAVDASANTDACGVATYFFGSEKHNTRSSTGERFASLVQREIVARTDLVDLRTHAKAWEFLRRTRMPAVQVDAGYLSNPGDAQRLADPGFRDVLAEAVVVAVQRFYLSPEADAHTGVLRLSELRSVLAAESDDH